MTDELTIITVEIDSRCLERLNELVSDYRVTRDYVIRSGIHTEWINRFGFIGCKSQPR